MQKPHNKLVSAKLVLLYGLNINLERYYGLYR